MEYAAALKKVQAKKPKENFMVIKLSYNVNLILPYKDGVAFMTSMVNAEKFNDTYGEKIRISGFDRNDFTATVMSCEEYEQIKIANLLGVTITEVQEAALVAT